MLINNSWFAGLSVFAFLSLLVGSAHAQSSAATCTAFGGVRFTIENSRLAYGQFLKTIIEPKREIIYVGRK